MSPLNARIKSTPLTLRGSGLLSTSILGCHSPKLDRARLELREALRYQSHSRISGSSQRSISMEWC